jgi:hypothetical protein
MYIFLKTMFIEFGKVMFHMKDEATVRQSYPIRAVKSYRGKGAASSGN